MCDLNNMSPNDVAVAATIIAIYLCKDRSQNEINALGNFITSIGTIMLTILAQQQTLQPQTGNSDQN